MCPDVWMESAAPMYDALYCTYQNLGYTWFSRAYDLNVIGIRGDNVLANKFDDEFCVAYTDANGRPRVFSCPCTVDPGLYYLQNPLNDDGCLIMRPGQYRASHKLGYHRGYAALVQVGPVTIYRDGNRNNRLDFGGREYTGFYGANIHRTLEDGIALTVGKFSAGCQVIQSPDDFAYIRALVRRQRISVGTDYISYTLLTAQQIRMAQAA